MPLSADVLIDYTNQIIYGEPSFLAGSDFYTVNEWYTYILDVFDQPAQMDDPVPFSQGTNVLTYIIANGWYVQQDLTKHLKGASVETTNYTSAVRVLEMDAGGYTNTVSGDIGLIVSGATTDDTANLLDYNNTTRKWWVRMTSSDDTFDTVESIVVSGGTGAGTLSEASKTGEELFSNILSVGTVTSGYPYVEQNDVTISSWWGTGNVSEDKHIDVLIKVKEADILIDSGDLSVYNRNYGITNDNVTVSTSGGGRNVAPIATQVDSSVTMSASLIPSYVATTHGGTGANAQISATFGSFSADIDDSGLDEYYACQVDCDSQPFSVVYQALQWICNKDRVGETLNGDPAELYQVASAGFTPVKSAPFAVLAGTTTIFNQGVYPINIGTGDYIATDNVGDQHTPPSTITVQITGVVSGDNVIVFKTSAGDVDKQMFTSDASANTVGTSAFTVQESVPKDTPAAGYIRVVHTSADTEQRYQYTSWSGSVFTLSTGLLFTYNTLDKVYVGYIDELSTGTSISKSVQYVDDRSVVVRVRNSSPGGNQIIPFEVNSTIDNVGLSIPASRNPDNVIGN